ncbi:MAG: SEC-C metal-binding domain-containing protein [Acetobacteraceae bacterium]
MALPAPPPLAYSRSPNGGRDRTSPHTQKSGQSPLVGFIDVGEGFEPAEDIDNRLDWAAANIPRAILLLRKLAKLRDRRATAPGPTRQTKPGRNAPCPCGSGRKYKRCCGQS